MIRVISAPLLLAFALSLAIVPLCRSLAARFGFFARPTPDRWHRRPVALFGGVGIAVVAFGCAAAFGLPLRIPVLIATATTMFLVGVCDDVLALKPATKLIAQIALASTLLFFGYRLNWLQSITLAGLAHALQPYIVTETVAEGGAAAVIGSLLKG